MRLGLKAGINDQQIADRMQYQPTYFEFHLTAEDVTPTGLARLRGKIHYVRSQQVERIILHHPMNFKGRHLELSMNEASSPERYRFLWQSTLDLLQLAKAEDVQLLVHGAYDDPIEELTTGYGNITDAIRVLFKRLDYLQRIGGENIMFENSISPIFYYGNPIFDQAIFDKGYRLAFDTSHCFIKLQGDQTAFLQSLTTLREHIVHYHLVDSMGQQHDGLQLGKGKIDWTQVLPRLNTKASSIYEVQLADQNNAQEMIASHRYLTWIERQLPE
ncbi:TIM barrel protein [Latilactobacillus graminis]|uniref:Xylose isomerase-like TIM barrel family protein n=2 Tax=Latilactobacillus graminis TaxID=60519 RepID=A0AA89I607_9LACO|nr:TIM barrel protein [Latilactobacillus graminis]KRM21039.1 xylose isomerase-like TIM barrel family protein [Latilactobacillus graminis DSM 20719]QFP79173.1 sugar phosphate isomerase/epimerase [Latilactobacillus graminis]